MHIAWGGKEKELDLTVMREESREACLIARLSCRNWGGGEGGRSFEIEPGKGEKGKGRAKQFDSGGGKRKSRTVLPRPGGKGSWGGRDKEGKGKRRGTPPLWLGENDFVL